MTKLNDKYTKYVLQRDKQVNGDASFNYLCIGSVWIVGIICALLSLTLALGEFIYENMCSLSKKVCGFKSIYILKRMFFKMRGY